MIKALFLVPVQDNDGHPFPRAFWAELDDRLVAAFGGFTRTPGISGAWQSGGRIYRDESSQFTLALTSWWDVPALLAIMEWVRVTTRQEALYVEIAGIPEIRSG